MVTMNPLSKCEQQWGAPANDNKAIYEISCYRANKTYNYFERDEILAESEEEE